MKFFKAHQLLMIFTTSLVAVLLATLIGNGTAFAQYGTIARVSPQSSSFFINDGNSASLQIELKNAYQLNGFDIRITYDPNVLTLVSWTHGGILQNLMKVIGSQTPGTLWLVYVQKNTSGFNGDGVLLNLNFIGSGPGTSAITIDNLTLVTTPDNEEYGPEIINGTLTAAYNADLLDKYHLSGSVSLQGQSSFAGVMMNLGPGDTYRFGPYSATSQVQMGENLDFGIVISDTYLITTSQERYINLDRNLNKTVVLNANKTGLNLLNLRGGNAVWTDNEINVADVSLVGAWYGKSLNDLVPGEKLDADVNFDGVVNLHDLALVAGNYGISAESAYAGWIP